VSSAAALYTGAKPPARSGSPTVTMAIAPTVRLSSFDTLLVAGTCRGDGERDGLGARQRTCASGRRAPLELHVSRAEVDNAEPDCARLHALGPCSRGLDQPRWDPLFWGPPGGLCPWRATCTADWNTALVREQPRFKLSGYAAFSHHVASMSRSRRRQSQGRPRSCDSRSMGSARVLRTRITDQRCRVMSRRVGQGTHQA
jgi:hypothetical protein